MLAAKILIVEDQAETRELLRLTLNPLSALLLEADTAEMGSRLAHAYRPDLVMLDVQLGSTMTGLELCREIKDAADLRHTRVVLVTTRSQAADIQAGTQAGADLYLTKPFSPAELLQVVSQLIQ